MPFVRESAYVCLNNDAHYADRFRVSCPEWETSINDPFCKKAKEDATVDNHQRYRRPVIVVNGFRFTITFNKPRSNGLCFALVLDLLGRTPESITSVLFNSESEQFDSRRRLACTADTLQRSKRYCICCTCAHARLRLLFNREASALLCSSVLLHNRSCLHCLTTTGCN